MAFGARLKGRLSLGKLKRRPINIDWLLIQGSTVEEEGRSR
jgi:hypothetical protein